MRRKHCLDLSIWHASLQNGCGRNKGERRGGNFGIGGYG